MKVIEKGLYYAINKRYDDMKERFKKSIWLYIGMFLFSSGLGLVAAYYIYRAYIDGYMTCECERYGEFWTVMATIIVILTATGLVGLILTIIAIIARFVSDSIRIFSLWITYMLHDLFIALTLSILAMQLCKDYAIEYVYLYIALLSINIVMYIRKICVVKHDISNGKYRTDDIDMVDNDEDKMKLQMGTYAFRFIMLFVLTVVGVLLKIMNVDDIVIEDMKSSISITFIMTGMFCLSTICSKFMYVGVVNCKQLFKKENGSK